jgi:VCBS repeat-containing protein
VGSVSSVVNGSFASITIAADGSYTYNVDNDNPTVQALRTTSNTLSDVFTYTMQDSGGPSAADRNVITGQSTIDARDTGFNGTGTKITNGTGISLTSGATNTTIQNNYIGTNVQGTVAIGNYNGILVHSGASAGALVTGNVVSGNVIGSFGSISIAADGSYTFTVDNSNPTVQALRTNSDTLQDVFTYTMRDTDGVTSTTQITITIHSANDTP